MLNATAEVEGIRKVDVEAGIEAVVMLIKAECVVRCVEILMRIGVVVKQVLDSSFGVESFVAVGCTKSVVMAAL